MISEKIMQAISKYFRCQKIYYELIRASKEFNPEFYSILGRTTECNHIFDSEKSCQQYFNKSHDNHIPFHFCEFREKHFGILRRSFFCKENILADTQFWTVPYLFHNLNGPNKVRYGFRCARNWISEFFP